jgi:hypothetical protein
MPRPRKYVSPAEKNKAYRARKKLKENEHAPALDNLAKAIHGIYKKRAENEIGHAEHLVGKTPFETLCRVVLYDVLYNQNIEGDASWEFPGWENMIMPVDISNADGPIYEVKNLKHATGVMVYLPNEAAFFGDEKDEQEKDYPQ